MKDKNLPNNYNSLSLEELTKEANRTIEELESKKDLQNSIENYQILLKLNNIIEKKFQKNAKKISEKTKENISKITSKKNAKTNK
ncbi:exonuclease VII small subunit [Pelagibacterales bacterium SAG-MED07]|nr:exonuclease VII small subunit [Pelagibacterales bacterium SAG-MED07]